MKEEATKGLSLYTHALLFKNCRINIFAVMICGLRMGPRSTEL
jgi:hypothetical protein